MKDGAINYGKFYFLEKYLFDEASPRFLETGEIDPPDFYMVVIWKANRAKTRVRRRLTEETGSFSEAVKRIASSLRSSSSPERRLEILMKEWKFRLPMATAILTVFYPSEFTVYDVRVCNELGKFHDLAHRLFSKKLWAEYRQFVDAVKSDAPKGLSLRDKDRYLWGRSFHMQVLDDLKRESDNGKYPRNSPREVLQ